MRAKPTEDEMYEELVENAKWAVNHHRVEMEKAMYHLSLLEDFGDK